MLSIYFNKLLAAIRFLFRERLSVDSNTIERKIRDFEFCISEKEARDYHESIDSKLVEETSEGSLIHPLYLTKISWHIVERLNDFLETPIEPKLLKMLVHMSNHFSLNTHLVVGKNYRVVTRLSLIEPRAKGTRLMIRLDYYDEDFLVATEHTSGLLYGVKCIGGRRKFGDLPKNERIDGAPKWNKKVSINAKLPYQFADKAQIDAPIHTDPKFAKSIGLRDIILQGTCTFAKAVTEIIEDERNELSYRDVSALAIYFTGMLLVPNDIHVRVLHKKATRWYFDVVDQTKQKILQGGQLDFISRDND